MSDTVNLMVVGVSGDLSRAEMTQKLVEEFGQSPVAFDPLLDAAFGESAPYAAQSDVNFTVAEAGKAQLESFGILCLISTDAEETVALANLTAASSAAAASSPDIEDIAVTEALHAPDNTASDSTLSQTTDVAELDPESTAAASDTAFESEDDVDSAALDATVPDTVELATGEAKAEATEEELSFAAQAEEFGEIDFSEEMGDFDLPADAAADDAEEAAVTTPDSPNPKSDVPDALTSVSFDDLQAELVDPGPAVKEKKAPVVMDDGGLSLSDDDSAPLTTPKAKSNPDAADDGGISLAEEGTVSTKIDAEPTLEDAAPVTEPVVNKADSELKAIDPAPVESALDDAAAVNVEGPGAEAIKDKTVDIESAAQGEDTALAATIDTAENNITPAVESVAAKPAPAKEPEAEQVKVAEAAEPVAAKPAPPAAAEPVAAKPTPPEAVQPVAAKPAPPAAAEPVAAKPAPPVAVEPKQRPVEAQNVPVAQVKEKKAPASAGLVLAGQPARSFVPKITPEDQIENVKVTPTPTIDVVTDSGSTDAVAPNTEAKAAKKKAGPKQGKTLKVAAALAGVVALAGGGTFALMNAGSLTPSVESERIFVNNIIPANDMELASSQVNFQTAQLPADRNLEDLSTEDLLLNLSLSSNANTIVDLGPYFQDSVPQSRAVPRLGAAVPAESESMVGVKNRVPHPADSYFDRWSSRESDLLLFLALLDTLIEKGELNVAQQLSDRAKDKLFAVMSSQRLARAYSDVGKNEDVAKLMASATRDTFSIKASEERVLALSDFALTEQTIGLNEDAIDSFLKASILARSLGKPELKTVGLSSAARYFQRSGRDKEAEQLLAESMRAGEELPRNTAARDLAVRYVAMSEARIGLFNQALDHVETIVDPFAAVSAYHGIALAIENAGDVDNARKVLNMAYRAGSRIADKDERSKLLSKVVLVGGSD